ncbi:MmcB family DNA repair protein [Rhizobium sp. CC-YZS058]|uniref:MmcB family DNA repair protein n=1 Tax=Rhizobium sp. CC-YZS058 TaxID=3042153 RepID=UPI002B05ECE0|nr:MmcB family DNA repair protein [Rhizobium sp. CC-YZS058]MEA3536805.1 MmcB family DNA repair protein [Rhizobium sp. CC-YZS058]
MAIISLHKDTPLIDGRQSARAMMVRRGVQRHLYELRHAVLPELTLSGGRRADLVSLSPKGELWIVEIKTSIEDFRVDRKWPDYRMHCDRLFFATHAAVPLDIFPEDCGLILSDGYGAEMLRDAPEHKLSAHSRKAVSLNFARAAAQRLMLAEWYADRHPDAQADRADSLSDIISGARDDSLS